MNNKSSALSYNCPILSRLENGHSIKKKGNISLILSIILLLRGKTIHTIPVKGKQEIPDDSPVHISFDIVR